MVVGASRLAIKSKDIVLLKGLTSLFISAFFPVLVISLLNRVIESRILKTAEQLLTITIMVVEAVNEQSVVARLAGVDPTTKR